MKRSAISFLRFALSIALAVGIVLSPNAQSQSHDFAKIAEIVDDHQAELDDHGHAHEDIVYVVHAFQGHAHDMADHDHNVAYLPPKRGTGFITPARTNWSLTEITISDRSVFGLDRPPRA
jgi:hypothetical protein